MVKGHNGLCLEDDSRTHIAGHRAAEPEGIMTVRGMQGSMSLVNGLGHGLVRTQCMRKNQKPETIRARGQMGDHTKAKVSAKKPMDMGAPVHFSATERATPYCTQSGFGSARSGSPFRASSLSERIPDVMGDQAQAHAISRSDRPLVGSDPRGGVPERMRRAHVQSVHSRAIADTQCDRHRTSLAHGDSAESHPTVSTLYP